MKGQKYELIFAPNGGYCVYLSQHAHFRKIRNITRIFPSFSWGIFYNVTCFNKINRARAKLLMDYHD